MQVNYYYYYLSHSPTVRLHHQDQEENPCGMQGNHAPIIHPSPHRINLPNDRRPQNPQKNPSDQTRSPPPPRTRTEQNPPPKNPILRRNKPNKPDRNSPPIDPTRSKIPKRGMTKLHHQCKRKNSSKKKKIQRDNLQEWMMAMQNSQEGGILRRRRKQLIAKNRGWWRLEMDLSPKIFTGGGLDEKKSKKKKEEGRFSLLQVGTLSLSLLWTPLCSPSTLSLSLLLLSLSSFFSFSL